MELSRIEFYHDWHEDEVRRRDRKSWDENPRDIIAYLEKFEGLSELFAYVRDNTESRSIVDIGAGRRAVGVNQLAANELGQGLSFSATGVVGPDEGYKGVPFLVASGENLEGIPDASVGGVLGMYSITYTYAPETVVREIDRILVPGGVVKTRLIRRDEISRGHVGLYIATPDHYLPHLKSRGFDCALNDEGNIILAIKSGNRSGADAAELLRRDKQMISQKLLK